MQPNAGPTSFRPLHLLLQSVVFCGLLIPFGEVLGPGFIGLFLRHRPWELRQAARSLVAFQMSWLIYRIILGLLVLGIWMDGESLPLWQTAPNAKVEEPSGEKSEPENFSIPGEPDRFAFEEKQLYRRFAGNQNFGVHLERLIQRPSTLIWTIGCILLFAFLWMVSSGITVLNLALVAQDAKPWYPLTLPWLKRWALKNKNGASLTPAPSVDIQE